MVIIERAWNTAQCKWELTYLANAASDVAVADLDPDCAIGSSVLEIASGAMYIKNTAGQWQKSGSTEVLA